MVKESKNSNSSGFDGVEIRSNGTVRLNFQYQSVRCRETITNLGTSKKDLKFAHGLRCEVLSKIATGTFNYGEFFPDSKKAKIFGFQSGTILMEDLFNEYLKEVEQTVKPSTFNGYRKSVNGVLRKKFGTLQVRHVSPKLIKEWILSFTTTAKTVKNYLAPLNAVLGTALNDGLIKENPLNRLDVAQLLKHKPKSESEIDPFSIDEINQILSVADDVEKNLFQFAFFSGLRTSELIGLRWDDVDFKTKVVNVSRAVIQGKEGSTKTKGSTRAIPLLPPALEALKNQRALTGFSKGRVFINPITNNCFTSDQQIRRSFWKPLLLRAEIRYRKPYQTRHTFASILISKGENIWMVAEFMGHNNIEMILKHYGKWIPDDKTSQYKHDYSSILSANA